MKVAQQQQLICDAPCLSKVAAYIVVREEMVGHLIGDDDIKAPINKRQSGRRSSHIPGLPAQAQRNRVCIEIGHLPAPATLVRPFRQRLTERAVSGAEIKNV